MVTSTIDINAECSCSRTTDPDMTHDSSEAWRTPGLQVALQATQTSMAQVAAWPLDTNKATCSSVDPRFLCSFVKFLDFNPRCNRAMNTDMVLGRSWA